MEDNMLRLFDDALASGITTFDMAHNYGGGDVERVFGKWLKSRGVRDEVVVLTKGAHHSQDRKRVTPFDIESDVHDSLARLGTDFIDIYLLHRDDESQPVGPIVAKLNEYHEKGAIGIYGGSNWSIERIEEANAWAAANGAEPFRASSPNFSLADQVAVPWEGCMSISGPGNHDERAWYQEAQMPLFTWSSLAGGFFSGRFQPDNLDSFSDYYDRVVVDFYCSEDNFERLARAQILALEKSLTVAQIAVATSSILRWTSTRSSPAAALKSCAKTSSAGTGAKSRRNGLARPAQRHPLTRSHGMRICNGRILTPSGVLCGHELVVAEGAHSGSARACRR